MPRLSIIVPALTSGEPLDETLVSILENRPSDSRIVLACDQRYDDPYSLGDEVDFAIVDETRSWTHAANVGLQHTLSEFVHVLLPGINATPGWCETAMNTLAGADDSTVAVIPKVEFGGEIPESCGLGFTRGGRLINLTRRGLAERRVAVHGAFPGSGFYRQDALLRIGGWNEAVHPRLASIDMMVRFCELGKSAVFDDSCSVTANQLTQAMQMQSGDASHFMLARDAEQLYLRCANLGCVRSSAHLGTWLQSVVDAIPTGTVFSEVAGRLIGRFDSWRKKNAAPELSRRAA